MAATFVKSAAVGIDLSNRHVKIAIQSADEDTHLSIAIANESNFI